ncbi:S8 family serine peptidase [Solwaraspora sp. WMMA2065]|uniref:S8 family serine peptidase n=1 Tax=Solwaraspora sp. WMMA2065 TaxID=3015166 RepID=UPI00259BC9EB|nr:S8 family serine peptidase [Solwaraspora sp. WMMA2065]WJK35529.1 S8 family serine peptidase [Solwaraspora sp. WMMA2065]
MRPIARALSLVLLAGVALAAPNPAAAAPRPGPDPGGDPARGVADKIQPELERSLQSDGATDLWIRFAERADLAQARQIDDWTARGEAVAEALRTTAATSQTSVRHLLDTEGVTYQAFWASNAIYVLDGSSMLAQELAARPDVEGLYQPVEYQLIEPTPDEPVRDDADGAGVRGTQAEDVEWGIANINADDVWEQFGTRGAGITVANLDTGVQFDHPALVAQYRGNLGDGTYDHNYNWFDADSRCGAAPCDRGSHGTHTMGTMVGDGGTGNRIGVAPDANWIAANGCCPTDAALVASGQWLLAPTDLDGQNPDAGKRPHIINNSWGSTQPSLDPFMEDVSLAWDAAGILGIWSNGNSGAQGCQSSGSPGSRSVNYSVGAYDVDNEIAYFSGRGPGQDGEFKPNISAPGVAVRSSGPGDSYYSENGTSMAAPHVAGTAALLWSAAPALIGDTDATRELFDRTAIDTADPQCGGTGADNNVYGEGRLDALALLEAAPAGDTGTLSGVVTDAATGAPVEGATVTIGGETVRERVTAADGSYSVRLTVGTYPVTVTAFGYAERSTEVTVTLGGTTIEDVSLTALPTMALSGLVRDGSGHGWPLYAKVSVAGTEVSTFTNPFNGRYRLVLPTHATYTLVVEPQYDGYGTVEQPVQVHGGNRTMDVAAPVQRCASAPGYAFSAGIGILGDEAGKIGTFLDDQGVPTTEVGWDTDVSGYDAIIVNRPSNPGEETFLRFLADTDAAGVGVLFLDTWSNVGGNGIYMLSQYTGNPGARSSGIVYDTEGDLSYQVMQEHPVVEGFPLGGRIAFDETDNYSKYYGFFDAYGGEGRMVIANAVTSEVGTVGVGIGVQQRTNNRHVLLSMHAASYNTGPQTWHDDSARVFSNAVDWITETEFECVKVEGGLAVGFVRDANTGAGLADAEVTPVDGSVGTRTVATPQDPDLDDGFYALFSPAGRHRITASVNQYAELARWAEVTEDWVTRHNYKLAAGRLTVTGSPVEATVQLGGATTAEVTVTNTGGAPAEVELSERAGEFEIQRADGSRAASRQIAAAAGAPTRRIPLDAPIEQLAGAASATAFGPGAAPAATPAAEPWLGLPGLPRTVMDNSAVTVDGKLYSFGGSSGLSSLAQVYVYDPVTQAWSRLDDMPYGARSQAAEGVIGDKVYLVSGWSTLNTDTLIFDPATGGWSTGADVPAASAAAGSAVLDGELYVVGGCTTTSCAPYSDQVFRYDPRADAWDTVASYPVPIAWQSCGAVSGGIVCAGGLSNSQPVTASYSYDPASDSWTQVADLPVNLWGSAYHTADNQLLISGGGTGTQAITNEGYAYDPATDAWSPLPTANSPSFRPGSACGLYRVGGSAISGFQPTSTVELLPGFDQCGSMTDTEWLTVDPGTATIAPGESLTVTLTLTAEVAQPGTYTTGVTVFEDTPYAVDTVPVTMTVTPPDTWGKITGTVSAVGCDGDLTPITGATVQLSTWTMELPLTTDADGGYAHWLDHRHNPVTMIVAKDGYMPQTRQTQVTAGDVRVEDWALRQVCGRSAGALETS